MLWCSMNDMPSTCMLLTFASNSTRLFFLPLTMGRRQGWSMLTMRCLTSLPENKMVYVKKRGKTVAYGTYNLSIPDGTGRVYQNVTDRAVYDLRNIRAISPSHEKRGFLPRLLLWLRLVHATANSLSGSWEWIRLSSFFAKLSRQLCKKSNSVKGKVGFISDFFYLYDVF